MNKPIVPLNCCYCNAEGSELVKHRRSDGKPMLWWRCPECGRNAVKAGYWVPQAGYDLDALRWDDEITEPIKTQEVLFS